MICDDVGGLLDVQVILLVAGTGTNLEILAASDPAYHLDTMDTAAATWALDVAEFADPDAELALAAA